MSSYSTTLGLVINKRNYQENGLVVTLLTPEMGKITARAIGAKNIKSSRLSSLQLGNNIKAHLYDKNGQLWLSESTTITSFLHSRKTLTQHNLLFYFLELINQLVAENQHTDGIYQLSVKLVQAINDNNVKSYIHCEIELIKLLGFGLPSDVISNFDTGQYKICQKYLKNFLESVVERKLESNKLFR